MSWETPCQLCFNIRLFSVSYSKVCKIAVYHCFIIKCAVILEIPTILLVVSRLFQLQSRGYLGISGVSVCYNSHAKLIFLLIFVLLLENLTIKNYFWASRFSEPVWSIASVQDRPDNWTTLNHFWVRRFIFTSCFLNENWLRFQGRITWKFAESS